MLEKLDQGAREFFTYPISAADEDRQPITLTTATITFTTGAGTVTKTVPIVDGKFRVFLAGPTAPAHDDAVVLPLGRTTYKITATDVTEILVSEEGTIRVD